MRTQQDSSEPSSRATEWPMITLVTPTYNQAEFLEETLQNVAAQEYPRLEHIVLDAMSTDGTEDILKRYHHLPYLRVIREADSGQSNAINKGMRLGTGTIAGWLNSDDLLYPGALFEVARGFQEHPAATVVFGRGAKMRRNGEVIYLVPFRPFSRRDLRTAYRVVQPAMFFKRDRFLEVGGLDEALEYAMDWELLLRLTKGGEQAVAIDKAIAKIRYYEETKTSTGGWKRMQEIAEIGRKYHGWWDANYLSYCIRTVVSRLGVPFAEKVVDEVLRRSFGKRPVMVQGWPHYFVTKEERNGHIEHKEHRKRDGHK